MAKQKSPAAKTTGMIGFIEVTECYKKIKFLLPIDRICFVQERGDGRAVINFEMYATDRECTTLIEKISDIVTAETYGEVVSKIKLAQK